MIRVEKKDDKFFINGKEVKDPLEFSIKERKALEDFKKLFEGRDIKSTTSSK